MKCDKKTMLLYAVTDRAWVGRQSLYEQVECALKGGATCVQVREKKLGDEDFLEEAKQAVRDGADCLGVGAMFSTSTKTDVDVLPKETLKAICDAVDIPVVAIGGLNKSNILELSGTGVDGVALVSAIFSAEDIESECRELPALSEKMVNA